MRADVFISYAASDKRVADAVCARLEARGIRCWISPRDIEPGRTWASALLAAIRATRVMVVILSREANRSPHVLREVERAVSDGDFIVPFRIEDVQPSDDMELLISSSHWLDAISPPIDQHIQELAQSIESLLGSRAPHKATRGHRRAVVKAAGHLPTSSEERERGRRARKWWIAGVLYAAIGAAAVVVALGWGGDSPVPTTPGNGELLVGPVLLYDWEPESRDYSGLAYEIQRESADGTAITSKVRESSYAEKGAVFGPITWRVRTTWTDAGDSHASGWSKRRTVTWYPDTLTKIRETGILSVAITEDATRVYDAENQPTGFEIEFMRLALNRYLEQHGGGIVQIVHSRTYNWGDEFFHSLESHRYDVMVGSISIDAERESVWGIEFTEPVISYRQALVHMPGPQNQTVCFASDSTSPQCRIGVKEGTKNEELALSIKNKKSNVEVKSFPDENVYNVLVNALVNGQLELALVDEPFAIDMRVNQSQDILRITHVDDSVYPGAPIENIGIGTKTFDIELRDVLNKAIPSVAPDIETLIEGYERLRTTDRSN